MFNNSKNNHFKLIFFFFFFFFTLKPTLFLLVDYYASAGIHVVTFQLLKSPIYFIAGVPSNPLLILPFNCDRDVHFSMQDLVEGILAYLSVELTNPLTRDTKICEFLHYLHVLTNYLVLG